MTIHRNYGEVEFHCDVEGCPEVLETETRDWEQAVELFYKSSWIVRSFNNTFAHVCPDCLEAERPEL